MQLVNFPAAVSLALHTMALLATDDQRRFRNQEIAETLRASGHHLAKVMQRLSKAGLVDSASGPQGGFLLGKPADQITLLGICEAIDGPLEEGACLLGKPICPGNGCILGEVLHSTRGQLRDYLSNTTVAELAMASPLRS